MTLHRPNLQRNVLLRPSEWMAFVVAAVAAILLLLGGTWVKAEGVAWPRGVLVVASALCFLLALRLRLRQWRVLDTPTSGCGGVAIGTCEVSGRAEAVPPLQGPASNVPCVWFDWQLQEYVSSGKSSSWHTRQHRTSHAWFNVTDETGHVLVVPQHAEFMGFAEHRYPVAERPPKKWRQVERRLELGAPTYVLGPVSVEGTLDVLAFCTDDPGDEFIVSGRSEKSVGRRLGFGALSATAFGAIAAVLAFVLYAHQGFDSKGKPTVFYGLTQPARRLGPLVLTVLAVYAAALLLGWLVRAYNRLVQVRNQCEKAWSLIAVELQRRHDLIGRLLEVVHAYQAYEVSTHERVALDRALPDASRLRATATDDDSTRTDARGLVALGEQYPDLHADEQFTALAGELTRTENRIEVARTFYNDAITVLRDRRGTFPYVLVAALVTCPTFDLFRSDAAARQPVAV